MKKTTWKVYIKEGGLVLFSTVSVVLLLGLGMILGAAIERDGKWPIPDPRK